jgi:hypothetical protein
VDEDDDGLPYGVVEEAAAETDSAQLSQAEMLEKARQHAMAAGKLDQQPQIETPVKKKKKRKKKQGFFDAKETLKLVAGVGVVVALVVVAAWRLPDFRFPLGGILCVVGFITYLLGWVSLRQLVAEEGALQSLMFRFLPPYQWWYVMTHWAETRDYVAFFASGLMILALGGAIIKISPVGKEAAESERAFQKATRGTEVEAEPPPPQKAAENRPVGED